VLKVPIRPSINLWLDNHCETALGVLVSAVAE